MIPVKLPTKTSDISNDSLSDEETSQTEEESSHTEETPTLLSKLLDNPEDAEKLLSVDARKTQEAEEVINPEICIECDEKPPTIFCFQCNDSFCAECFQIFHSKGNRKNHQTSQVIPNHKQPTTQGPENDETPAPSLETQEPPIQIPVLLNINDKLPSPSPSPILTPSAVVHSRWYERAKYIPLRLTREERKRMRLIDAVLSTCNYTDLVDNTSFTNSSKRIGKIVQELCGILTGLVISVDYKVGQQLIADRDFAHNGKFYQNMFEIGRRYKITNPDKMRSSYGKLMYCLMDSQLAEVRDMLGFNCVIPIRSVYQFLEKHGITAMLDDPLIDLATMEIYATDTKKRAQVDREIKMKEKAVKVLSTRYSRDSHKEKNGHVKSKPVQSGYGYYSWGSRPRPPSPDLPAEICGGPENLPKPLNIQTNADPEDVKWALYSLADNQAFLRFNSEPCRRMLEYLDMYFDGDRAGESIAQDGEEDTVKPKSGFWNAVLHPFQSSPQQTARPKLKQKGDLSIEVGVKGARLRHDHTRQFHYVKQTLTLWNAILTEMFKLWSLAEQDLLDPRQVYQIKDTGQGRHRMQVCSRVGREMTKILRTVQSELKEGWIGSSVIHLGDTNVPNAFLFIDKYAQISRILTPIVLVLDKIPVLCKENHGIQKYIEQDFGSADGCRLEILQDFFRFAFDGSGSDSFFEAGSCIDGRLTSAWNWCSKLEQKRFFPVFLLTGFTSFDGQF
ncbi:putative UPF0652 like protein [Blattamonas nauphoetae]|uniref:UPF0652 like protein n=1 Tax=Blattamonas nauphoetae TaxID=2049346 RepID=A0ABQ9X0R2_9EUKA|nr:putative UPF0652 like protein [Blattamonas nauphoetae]